MFLRFIFLDGNSFTLDTSFHFYLHQLIAVTQTTLPTVMSEYKITALPTFIWQSLATVNTGRYPGADIESLTVWVNPGYMVTLLKHLFVNTHIVFLIVDSP